MKLPIDTSQMMFVCTTPAEPVTDFATKRPKADENGEPLFAVQVAAIADGTAEIISVKVAGQAPRVAQGAPVTVHGLVASPWTMGERSGIAYKAERIQAVTPAPAPAAASTRASS